MVSFLIKCYFAVAYKITTQPFANQQLVRNDTIFLKPIRLAGPTEIIGKGQLCFTIATSISFDTSQDYTKLEFGNPEPLDEETLVQAYELAQKAHTALPADTE